MTEAADRAQHGVFERHRVIPAIAAAMPRRTLEGFSETDPRVAHGNHDHATTESARVLVRLHGDPATKTGMLHDILTRFTQRHPERAGDGRIEIELAVQDIGRLLLNAAHHPVHVVTLRDRCDLEQHIRLVRVTRARHRAMHVVQLGRMTEKSRARPVRHRVGVLRHREAHAVGARLRDAQQRRQSVGRRPSRMTGVNQDLVTVGDQRQLLEDLLEALLIE